MKRLIWLLFFIPIFSFAQVGEDGKTYTWNPYTKAKDVVWITGNGKYITQWFINYDTTLVDTFYIKYQCPVTGISQWGHSGDTIFIDSCSIPPIIPDTFYLSYECDPVLNSGWRSNGDTIYFDTCYISTTDTNLWRLVNSHLETKGIDSVWADVINSDAIYNDGYAPVKINDSTNITGGAYFEDGIYVERDEIPFLEPNDPKYGVLTLKKLDASTKRQIAMSDWESVGDSIIPFIPEVTVSDSTWDLTNDGSIQVQPYNAKKVSDPGYAYFYDDDSTYTVSYDTTFGLTGVKYGYLYNWYVGSNVSNLANIDWRVPTYNDAEILALYLDPDATRDVNDAGKYMKEIGLTYWLSNTGATNSTKLNIRGAGLRNYNNGTFTLTKQTIYLWYSTFSSSFGDCGVLTGGTSRFQTTIGVETASTFKKYGCSIRLIKENTSLTNGQEGSYVGNDGKIYRTICINTQEWLADNLCETKYRNGDLISEVTDNSTWAALTTAARCSYNNAQDSAYTGTEIVIDHIDTIYTPIDLPPSYTNKLKLDGILDATDLLIKGEPITSGIGDNLGNHIADTTLNMGNDNIINIDTTRTAELIVSSDVYFNGPNSRNRYMGYDTSITHLFGWAERLNEENQFGQAFVIPLDSLPITELDPDFHGQVGDSISNYLSNYQEDSDTNIWDATLSDLTEATTQYIFDPDASIVTRGIVASGTVNTADIHDNVSWTLNEQTGGVGYNFQMIYDSVDKEINRVWFHGHYFGAGIHSVIMQMWNYTSSSWENYTSLTDRPTDEWLEFSIPDPADHRRNDSVIIRFYHSANGESSHRLYIDYCVLVKTGFGSTAFTEDDPVFRNNVGDSIQAYNNLYKEELTNAKTIIPLTFPLSTKSSINYNGTDLRDYQWTGIGTDTLILYLDVKQYDFLTIKQ